MYALEALGPVSPCGGIALLFFRFLLIPLHYYFQTCIALFSQVCSLAFYIFPNLKEREWKQTWTWRVLQFSALGREHCCPCPSCWLREVSYPCTYEKKFLILSHFCLGHVPRITS